MSNNEPKKQVEFKGKIAIDRRDLAKWLWENNKVKMKLKKSYKSLNTAINDKIRADEQYNRYRNSVSSFIKNFSKAIEPCINEKFHNIDLIVIISETKKYDKTREIPANVKVYGQLYSVINSTFEAALKNSNNIQKKSFPSSRFAASMKNYCKTENITLYKWDDNLKTLTVKN